MCIPGERRLQQIPFGSSIERLLNDDAPPFALLQRSGPTGPGDTVELFLCDVGSVDRLADIVLPGEAQPARERADGPRQELIVVVPYRQIAERGLACPDDGTPLVVMSIRAQATAGVAEARRWIPDRPIAFEDTAFDIGDDDYADVVRRIQADEIGQGQGSNFVIRRALTGRIEGYSPAQALTLFRRLLSSEVGAYWTFVIHTGQRTMVGASPERHVSLVGGTVIMNPISGTYRYPRRRPDVAELLRFLGDRKEADELYMVVDEELKMMAAVCERGGQVVGPRLKEMAQLAHTEYLLTGRSSLDPRDVLRETMFSPAVTGSPLESACRVISQYEPEGRGYYSGVVALLGRDEAGRRIVDSSILIRTADIDRSGRLEIGVGTTLVRHSDPDSEVVETHAKVAALLDALSGDPAVSPGGGATAESGDRLQDHPLVRQALRERNRTLSRFWLDPPGLRAAPDGGGLTGRTILVVEAEDAFTAMLGHQLRALGPEVEIRRFDRPFEPSDFDLVVVGPGPGDPRQVDDPRMAALRQIVGRLLSGSSPFLAVCLGHQVLSAVLGLEVIRLRAPNQGVQREIDLFGRRVRVGFYNTFAAVAGADRIAVAGRAGVVEVSRDSGSGEVHALRGPGFRSLQFHPESVLSQDGFAVLRESMTSLLPPSRSIGEPVGQVRPK